MSNLPENRKHPQQPGPPSFLPEQAKKYPKIKELVAPVGKTIPELLEESVAQQEHFKALVEQGEMEMEVSYFPAKAGKKQELNFKFRS